MKVERCIRFKDKRVKGRVITLAYFYSLPNSKDPDVVSRCNKDELIAVINTSLSKGISHIARDEIIVHADELYEKLLIYAVVRQTFRNPEKAIDLRSVVRELGFYETHFWASSFAEIYKLTSSRRALYRPARAFKIFYGLAVK